MQCRYVGFRFEVGEKVERAKVLADILAANGILKKYRGHERKFEVARLGEYVVGRWTVLKGRSTYIQFDTDTEAASIGTLPLGYQLAACNYFILHEKTLCGLYQHYSGASSMRDFCDFLSSCCKKTVDRAFRAAIKDAGGKEKASAGVLKKIQEAYLFTWHSLYSRDKLEELLLNLDRLTEVFYTVATVRASKDEYGPLDGDVRAEVHRLKLTVSAELVDSVRKRFVARVVDFFTWIKKKRNGDIDRSGVTGKQGKRTRTIRIGDIVEQFGDDDLDKVLTQVELAIVDVRLSPLVAHLIELAEENEVYFRKGAS